MRSEVVVRYNEERGTLKQQHLVGVYDVREGLEVVLQFVHVGDELVHDAGPGLRGVGDGVSVWVVE